MGSTGERALEGEFVGVFEAGPGGEALSEPGEGERVGWVGRIGPEQVSQVVSGGLALDVGSQGEDHLVGRGLFEPLEELGDTEGLWADVVEGGEFSPQGMVVAMEGSGSVEGQNVGGLLDDAEHLGIAGGVGAEGAGIRFGKKAADGAGVDGLLESEEGAA